MNTNMKRKKLFTAICLMTGLLLAGCSKDEMTDGNTLPEGQYPLEIASVTMSVESSEQPWSANAPQTRVAESENGESSVWKKGDVFYVKIEGYDEVGTYKITDAETGTVEAVTPIYWHSTTQNGKVTAWYTSPSATTDGTVDLSNQSKGLVYTLQATTNASYGGSPVSLNFTHQLSKVRVYLRGTAYEGNATGVTMNSYPASCTVANGEVTDSGTTGTIAMHPTTANGQPCFEANVPIGTLAKDNAFAVTLEGGTSVTVSLTADMTLAVANLHRVTLKLHKSGTTEVNLAQQTGAYEISSDGNYYFYGSGRNSINVTGGNPNIYLGDANISINDGNAISITSGSPTIIVQGADNKVDSGMNGAAISVAADCTVTIKGNGTDDMLTTTAGYEAPAIGNTSDCGNITIEKITLYANTSYTALNIWPGIGTYTGNCGIITITDATVHAKAIYAPMEGMPAIGSKSSAPTINVTNSTIHAYRGNDNTDYIGKGGSYSTANKGIQGTLENTTVYLYTMIGQRGYKSDGSENFGL